MVYVITEKCMSSMDRSCLVVCPVDCIYEASQMLVIDPEECIDCGACEPECPVTAIFNLDDLPSPLQPFVEINAAVRDGIDQVNSLIDAHVGSGTSTGVDEPRKGSV